MMDGTRTSRRPLRWAALVGALGLAIGSMGSSALAAETASAKPPAKKPPAQSDRAREAREKRLEEKLDQVLANQQTILQRFDQVMEELRIVKVRATVR